MKQSGVLLLAALLALSALPACRSAGPTHIDDQFGVYYGNEAWHEGRRTLRITPPDPETEYFYYPAVFDSIHIRIAPDDSLSAAQQVLPVEALIKGVLPDACTELHEATQERALHFINVTFTIRRPVGTICERTRTPFRFYLPLQGLYAPGDYTLKVNDSVFPFIIPVPGAQ